MTYEIMIDGKPARLSIDGDSFRYRRENGDVVEHPFSLAEAGGGVCSVLMNGRSYTVTQLGAGEVSVDGQVFHVEVFDPRSLRGRKAAGVTEGRQAVSAPMPGRVIRVLVEAGQQVEAGQGLIVVEAMKMQNEMKSPKAGRVAEVKTIDGATVLVGDVLVVIE
jgi:biotin carboxyl carrier protein